MQSTILATGFQYVGKQFQRIHYKIKIALASEKIFSKANMLENMVNDQVLHF